MIYYINKLQKSIEQNGGWHKTDFNGSKIQKRLNQLIENHPDILTIKDLMDKEGKDDNNQEMKINGSSFEYIKKCL